MEGVTVLFFAVAVAIIAVLGHKVYLGRKEEKKRKSNVGSHGPVDIEK